MSYNIRYKKAKTFQRTKANENNYDDTGFKNIIFRNSSILIKMKKKEERRKNKNKFERIKRKLKRF